MKYLFVLFTALLFVGTSFAQDELPDVLPDEVPSSDSTIISSEVLMVVETMPIFNPDKCNIEGDRAASETCSQAEINRFISTIRYPQLAIESDIEGRVYVKFIVNTSGEVEQVQIARGVHEILDNAAKRHVEIMPDWEPGVQKGKDVNVQYVLPINFQLVGDSSPDESYKYNKKGKLKKKYR